jgi:hypothetical protein
MGADATGTHEHQVSLSRNRKGRLVLHAFVARFAGIPAVVLDLGVGAQ